MKNFILLIVGLVLSARIILSQPCLPEGITFLYQWQIDNFQNDYPGCTEIEGDVFIGSNNPPITNLDGLNIIVGFGGDLIIWENWILSDFTGLNNVVSVAGDLVIFGNHTVTVLSEFNSLQTIGGYLGISNNDSLVSITGFPVLTAVGGLSLMTNDTLKNITGFTNLTSLNGFLSFSENYMLQNISGFSNLTTIAGDLNIRDAYGLPDLSALMNLTFVGGDIEISGNGSITSLSGLDNIEAESIGSLSIYNNYFLSECDVNSICDYLISPNGVVEIYSNYPGCNSVEEVELACENITSCLPRRHHLYHPGTN